jgi:hypothetical protein
VDPTPASSSTTVTLDTPLLRYRFEGSAVNSGAVGGYAGTATAVTYPTGKSGQSVRFDGTAATSVLLPGTATVLGRGGPLTISLWYREDVARTNAYLLSFRTTMGTDNAGWQSYHGTSGTLLTSCSAGGCFSFNAGTLGAWHNLTYRYATPGGPVEFWVDGVLAGTIANPGGSPLTASYVGDLVLGNSYFGALGNAAAANPSVFWVDELKIYDTAFTPAEQCTRVIGGTWNTAALTCTLP